MSDTEIPYSVLLEKYVQLKYHVAALKPNNFSNQLFEDLPIGLILIKDSGIISLANMAFCKIVGFEDEEVFGMDYCDFVAEEFKELECDKEKSLDKNGAFGPNDLSLIHKSGKIIPVRISGSLIEYEGERFIWQSVEDISDIKATQKKLSSALKKAKHNRALMAMVADNFPNSYISIINDDFTVGFTSGREFRNQNIDPNQFVGANLDDVFGEFAPYVKEQYQISFDGKENEFEMNMGNEHQLYKTVPVRSPDGKIRQILSVVENVTRQKEKEIELIEAKNKAEENEKLKSAFLANMSHEIRTPMNAILGFTDLLRQKGLTEDKQERYIDIVHEAGNRLLNLVSDIVDYSKIDSNEIELNYVCCDIAEEIHKVKDEFTKSPLAEGIQINCEVNLGSTTCFKTDVNRLHQVLSNLMENALKFTSKGSITLSVGLLDNYVAFSVKDTGVGIPSDQLEVIFDRFRQANNNKYSAQKGTGLGLSIVKGLVELMGGTVAVTSELNKGAKFTFTIPKDTCLLGGKPEKPEDQKIEFAQGLNALIVEDDKHNYEYLQLLLEGMGFNLQWVENGKDAISRCKESDFDVLFMDLKLPVINGVEAISYLRKDDYNGTIIAQSANTLGEEAQEALAAGATDFIPKPIIKNDLIKLLNKHLAENH